jgi:drug/metabolite transporter (DMT)-like permease
VPSRDPIRRPVISQRWLVPLALLGVYVVWGSTYLGIAVMVQTIPPLLGNAVRMLTAGTVMYLVLRGRGQDRPTARQWRNGAAVGTLLFVGGLGQVSIAESIGIGSGVAATAIAMTPVWASLVSGLFGSWPRRLQWIGLALGVAGVAALSLEGDFRAEPAGFALVLAAPILWSFGSVWSNHLDLPASNMRTALFMIGGGASLAIAGAIRGEVAPTEPSMASVLALLYLISFGSLLAFSAYAYLLRTVSASLATSYAYVNPLVAVALGVSLGGEVLTGSAFIALPLIVVAVALIARGNR